MVVAGDEFPACPIVYLHGRSTGYDPIARIITAHSPPESTQEPPGLRERFTLTAAHQLAPLSRMPCRFRVRMVRMRESPGVHSPGRALAFYPSPGGVASLRRSYSIRCHSITSLTMRV